MVESAAIRKFSFVNMSLYTPSPPTPPGRSSNPHKAPFANTTSFHLSFGLLCGGLVVIIADSKKGEMDCPPWLQADGRQQGIYLMPRSSRNTPFPRCTLNFNTVSPALFMVRLYGKHFSVLLAWLKMEAHTRNVVSVRAKAAVTVHPPHGYDSTKMERKSIHSKRQKQHRPKAVWVSGIKGCKSTAIRNLDYLKHFLHIHVD